MDKKAILRAVWFTPGPNKRWGIPLLFTGSPGVGKSSVIEGLAEDLNVPIKTLIASLREPSDFGGLPIPQDNGSVTYSPPNWAFDLCNVPNGIGVAFFDEITTCAPATQAALLRIILNGAVGDLQLPPGIRMVSACNPTDEAAGGWDLAPPLANRFAHLDWERPTGRDWCDWLVGGAGEEDEAESFDPLKEQERVMKHWHTHFAKARGLISGFIQRRPDLLFNMPKAGHPGSAKAWPSPRSWELATRCIAGAKLHGLNDVNEECLISATVGPAASAELITWIHEADLPDPVAVLDGKVKFEHDKRRLDRTLAVLNSCAAYIKPKTVEKRVERGDKLWELIIDIYDEAPDLIITSARTLTTNGLYKSETSRKGLKTVNDFLREAGITAKSR